MNAPSILRLEELTWRVLLALPRERTVVFVPISPVEEHGPHLPMGVDLFDAEAFGLETGKRLAGRRPEIQVVLYPRVPLGTDTFAYLGSIEIRQRVIRDLAYDIGRSLGREGFRHVVFMNAHGGPAHNVALDEAAARLWRHGVHAIAPFGAMVERLFLGEYNERIQAHLRANQLADLPLPIDQEYHGGAFETSLMMHLRPELVSNETASLPPFSVPLRKLRWSTALRNGPGLGYLGAPAAASAELGEGLISLLAGELADLCEALVDGQDVRRRARCRLYHLPLLWTDRWWYAAALLAIPLLYILFRRLG